MLTQWTELGYHRKEAEISAGVLTLKEFGALGIRIAPKPRNADTVQVGTMTVILYLDDQADQPQGTEENFLVGGNGEAWEEEGIVRVRAWDNPICEAIRGVRRGKIATVRTNDGKRFKIKVVRIQLPNLDVLRERCEAAVEERRQAA